MDSLRFRTPPLSDEQLAKDGMIQFPTVIGGVVPVVNIKAAPGQLEADRVFRAGRHLPARSSCERGAHRPAQPRRVAAGRKPIAAVRRAGWFGHQLRLSPNTSLKVSPAWKS